jgi:hypothetical protein
MPWWSRNPCWDGGYDGESEPKGERQELTRLGETAADALTGKPESVWNRGTHGDYDCDYSQAEHDHANAKGDVQRYYDQCNSADIEITIKRGDT